MILYTKIDTFYKWLIFIPAIRAKEVSRALIFPVGWTNIEA